MKKALFGKNIPASCEYCENCSFDAQPAYCVKNKKMKNGKCRAFKYDPLMRVPKTVSFNSGYTAEDFEL